jgi:peptide/nickel transport system permease protein
MLQYAIRRVVSMVPLLIVITALTFLLGQYGAGDLAAYLTTQTTGMQMDMKLYAELRETLGLNDPVIVRYWHWLANAVHGDLGVSYVMVGTPSITYLIGRALPMSLQLAFGALMMAVIVGIPMGVIAAMARNTVLDYLIVAGWTVLASIPGFVFAPMAMIVLVTQLHLLPSVGLGWHGLFSEKTILPALCLAIGPMLGIIRYTRASVLEVLAQEYVRAARAKGLYERMVITRHVIRNAMTPLLTILGMTAAGLVGGSIFIETIFNLPGFGQLAAGAIQRGDIQTSTGVLLVSASVLMIANLIVDLSYGLLDPRVQINR